MLVELKDFTLLKQLETLCFGETKYSDANINNLLQHAICYGIESSDAKIVGYYIIQASGDDFELLRIGILPAYRHQELATKHLKMWLSTLTKKCFLEVKANNTAAIALYKKCGFEVIHIRKNYYQDQQDAWVMQLK